MTPPLSDLGLSSPGAAVDAAPTAAWLSAAPRPSGEREAPGETPHYPSVRPATTDDLPWIQHLLDANWLGLDIAVHDELIDPAQLDALIAHVGDERVGLLTYRVIADGIEVVTVDSMAPGAGTALLYEVMVAAIRTRRQEVWLVTTNDNVPAISFYLRRGLRLESIDEGAVARARELKPGIPDLGHERLPIEDEFRFVYAPEVGAEAVDLYSPGGQVIGVAPRSEVRRRNLWHGATGVVVRDPAGRIYVHRRSATKDVYPGRFDFTAGGVLQAGEEPTASAVRELAEELGVTGVELVPLGTGTYADDATSYVAFLYQCTYDGPITHADGEVAWGDWLTVEELKTWIADPARDFMPDALALLAPHLDDLPMP